MDQYIEIGKIVATRGLKGEVKVNSWCNESKYFEFFNEAFLDSKGIKRLKIERVKILDNSYAILKFLYVDNIDDAKNLMNSILYANKESVPLEEGEHFLVDMIGMKVVDSLDSNTEYGTITDVVQSKNASDLYEVTLKNGKKCLIPTVEEFIKKINVDEKTVKISPIEGLFDNLY